ncbi:hypothetical protein BKA82DRAFT_1008113 [Pisolithus tinctorius]|uniref:Uncharacterized protein n=1 Tax=Pisolithus tinctorius Marx 270 TaxID=870435 RepID=A0A0C3NGY2_PISTI|nr:hypothetical protein BKA82DRAFT_1008113 [Pisolithus tinctorius]KIN94728.1 hypothetical protein M404DRAFT_1008113 [Pisolithus tinctorius Marx 270]
MKHLVPIGTVPLRHTAESFESFCVLVPFCLLGRFSEWAFHFRLTFTCIRIATVTVSTTIVISFYQGGWKYGLK